MTSGGEIPESVSGIPAGGWAISMKVGGHGHSGQVGSHLRPLPLL